MTRWHQVLVATVVTVVGPLPLAAEPAGVGVGDTASALESARVAVEGPAAVSAAAVAVSCPPRRPGRLAIVVAVDFGDLARAPRAPSLVCVAVPEGASGSDVLAARARHLGTPPPRYHSSGLLCAIDGLPRRGCGDPTPTGYRYWSYWHGTRAGWEYASVGPAGWKVREPVVEGWRFVDGAGRPTDPPPRVPAQVAVSRSGAGPGAHPRGRATERSGGSPAGAIAGAVGVGALLLAGLVVARRRAAP